MNNKKTFNDELISFLNFIKSENIEIYNENSTGFINDTKIVNTNVQNNKNNDFVENNIKSNKKQNQSNQSNSNISIISKDNIKQYIHNEKEKIGENPTIKDILNYLSEFEYAKNMGLENFTIPTIEQNCDILFFESLPSQNDINEKQSISGEKRELLNKILASVELSRLKYSYANSINWIRNDNNYTLQDLYVCHPFNVALINLINPKIVISLGRMPLKTFGIKYKPNTIQYNSAHFSQKILYSESLHDILNCNKNNVIKLKKKVFNDFKKISAIFNDEKDN